MNLPELWAEIEDEQNWRQGEIRFLHNHLASITDIEEQDRFRRILILMLYAHFEGFCKFTFTLYLNAVNQERITCGEANYAIAAVSLNDLFFALRDPLRKCPEFRRDLPDDTALHRFARDREFLEQSVEFEKRIVAISEKVVDIESNLKPVVLRKILYRLGFRHDQFVSIEGDIHFLLKHRNSIAHGESRDGVPLDRYNRIKDAAYKLMDEIKREVMSALQDKLYLRL
jgi:hypothetical protein